MPGNGDHRRGSRSGRGDGLIGLDSLRDATWLWRLLARGPTEGGGRLSALDGCEVGRDDECVRTAVRRGGEGSVQRGSGPDVVSPGEGAAGSDVRERDGLWRRREVERRRVDAEPFEGIADRDAVAERDHDGDLAGRAGVGGQAESVEEALEVASEGSGAQGVGAA